METTAEVVLHGEVESTSGSSRFKLKERLAGESGALHMSPGQQWLARIRLAGAALLLPGDRFIIRQFSPVVTIGGGTVMDAAPIPGLKGRSRLEALNALITNSADEAIRSRIARRSWHGISLPQLVSETGMTVGQLEIVLSPLIANGVIVRGANCLLHSESLSKLSTAVTDAVSSFHQSDPLAPGIGKGALREKVHASAEVLDLVLGSLARGKKVELAAELVRLPGRGLEMKDEESESKKKIEAAFSSAGLKVPPLPEVIAGLKIDKTRAQKIVTLMLREKILIKVSDDLVFHGEALDQLRRKILAYRETSARIDVAKFKDLTGVSRKYAIPLLEYLDRERVTRRVGDSRDIL
jgi:selenocysteine-specific elongation factor